MDKELINVMLFIGTILNLITLASVSKKGISLYFIVFAYWGAVCIAVNICFLYNV